MMLKNICENYLVLKESVLASDNHVLHPAVEERGGGGGGERRGGDQLDRCNFFG